ncbi:MAG: hypothetical protein ACYS80_19795 [Planctomycetota bacterium]|jgi:hypothetical protein
MKRKAVMLVLLVSLLTSCAMIPQESVDLSSEIGIGLKKQYKSQIDLVNLYFANKREGLDEVMTKALNDYFETLTPDGTIELNKSAFNDVATDVMDINSQNNAAKEKLEKARVLIIKKLNENYLALNQGNSTITGLLQSAVTIKEARSEAFKSLSNMTDGAIDLDKAFSKLDEFVLKGGGESGKTIDLVGQLERLFSENTGNEDTK